MSNTRQRDATYYQKQGFRFYTEGNTEAAIEQFDQGVLLSEPDAMADRAALHRWGKGGPVNFAEAIKLYDEVIHRLQTNCPQIYTITYSWSLFRRANMHENGEGCPVDFATAITLYEKAIVLGHPVAMHLRARMHENGRGGPVNFAEANRLHLLAEKALKTVSGQPVTPADSNIIHNMARSIDAINSGKNISDQLTDKQEKLLTHGYDPYDIPVMMIGCEKLKDDLLKTNVKLFDLLCVSHKSLSEAKSLELINNKLRHPPKTNDIQSDLETIASLLAPTSTPLPQALHCIAKHLQCVLSYEENKQSYIQAAKQQLNALKAYLDEAAQDQWPIKYFGKWIKGTPKHINAMQQALASLDCNDTISLLKTYKRILDVVRSITANTNRHPQVTRFYDELRPMISPVVYANSAPCMQLSAAAAPPPATNSTYGYVTNALASEPAQLVYLDPPPYYDVCPQPQRNNATVTPTATSAAAQSAPTASNQYSTRLFCAMFPVPPNDPMPAVNGPSRELEPSCGNYY